MPAQFLVEILADERAVEIGRAVVERESGHFAQRVCGMEFGRIGKSRDHDFLDAGRGALFADQNADFAYEW